MHSKCTKNYSKWNFHLFNPFQFYCWMLYSLLSLCWGWEFVKVDYGSFLVEESSNVSEFWISVILSIKLVWFSDNLARQKIMQKCFLFFHSTLYCIPLNFSYISCLLWLIYRSYKSYKARRRHWSCWSRCRIRWNQFVSISHNHSKLHICSIICSWSSTQLNLIPPQRRWTCEQLINRIIFCELLHVLMNVLIYCFVVHFFLVYVHSLDSCSSALFSFSCLACFHLSLNSQLTFILLWYIYIPQYFCCLLLLLSYTKLLCHTQNAVTACVVFMFMFTILYKFIASHKNFQIHKFHIFHHENIIYFPMPPIWVRLFSVNHWT